MNPITQSCDMDNGGGGREALYIPPARGSAEPGGWISVTPGHQATYL